MEWQRNECVWMSFNDDAWVFFVTKVRLVSALFNVRFVVRQHWNFLLVLKQNSIALLISVLFVASQLRISYSVDWNKLTKANSHPRALREVIVLAKVDGFVPSWTVYNRLTLMSMFMRLALYSKSYVWDPTKNLLIKKLKRARPKERVARSHTVLSSLSRISLLTT